MLKRNITDVNDSNLLLTCLILSGAGNTTDRNVGVGIGVAVAVVAFVVLVVLLNLRHISKLQTFSLQHFISGGK